MLLRILLITVFCVGAIRLDESFFDDQDEFDYLEDAAESKVEPITFKIKSLRDCGDRKDLVKFKRLFYPKTFTVPGFMELNGTMILSEKLPDDWHVSVNVQVKTYLGYVTLPCIRKCYKKNVCSSGELIRKCQELFKKVTSSSTSNQTTTTTTSLSSEYCRCDYDKGSVEIPALRVPLQLSEKRRNLIKTYSNSKEVKIEITFKSATNDKRFACFRGVFQVLKI